VGRSSKTAGIGFVLLSAVLLVLSVRYRYVVIEIDSIVAFVAGAVLLFRDPRARVPAGVFDAALASSSRFAQELQGSRHLRFVYVPNGASVNEVVLRTGPKGAPPWARAKSFTPPGRSLAELFVKESGLSKITFESISGSLPEVMRADFGLADSVALRKEEDGVVATIKGGPTECGCEDSVKQEGGCAGCPVASLLAVLVAAATNQRVSLHVCSHDLGNGSWSIPMSFEVSGPEGQQ